MTPRRRRTLYLSETNIDESMMLRALSLAKRGEGFVEPNPMVGCVIVRGGRIIGEGWHRRFGGPHAEINALRSCTESPRGATVYVSLEPCCHSGKTPPCTDTLIAAKVAEVVAPFPDPNPLVAGRGFWALRAAGIKVRIGIAPAPASARIVPFVTRVKKNRPFVILKWAQTQDGRLAASPGESRWISCGESRRWVHRLRARVDAILVGSGTVLADDPLLISRGVPIRRVARRVVLDARLRIPMKGRLVATGQSVSTQVFTTRARARSPKAEKLRGNGVSVQSLPIRNGSLHLPSALRRLAGQQVTNLLVEGGPTMLNSFLSADLADRIVVFIAPAKGKRLRRPNVRERTLAATMSGILKRFPNKSRRCGVDQRIEVDLRPC